MMTQEEKARRYDEVLEQAKSWYTDAQIDFKKSLETLFPELKCDDEKIRKEIIKCVKNYGPSSANPQLFKNMLAWLEKQGEQKPSTEVKPKFHEGDWVIVSTTKGDRAVQIASVEYSKDGYPSYFTTEGRWFGNGTKARLLTDKDVETIIIPESKVIAKTKFHEGDWVVSKLGNVWYIDSFDNKNYKVTDINGNHNCFPIYIQDRLHLWTIQDAKDGDVLASNRSIFIFSQEYIAGKPEAHCGIMNGLFLVKPEGCWTNEECYPATKEQRDLLFQKMVEPGWEWDSEKNELKKIEQTSVDKIEPKFKVGDWIISNNKKSIYQVIEVKRGIYVIRDNADNYEYHIGIEECEKSGKLFTIRDAKDGDVLVSPPIKGQEGKEQIFIFKGINSRDYVDNCIEYYCRVYEGVFYENENGNGYMGTTSSPLYPATKEQRDTLFAKMKEAGYEWDAEKKELKKISQRIVSA